MYVFKRVRKLTYM